jgi:hypothetical protein
MAYCHQFSSPFRLARTVRARPEKRRKNMCKRFLALVALVALSAAQVLAQERHSSPELIGLAVLTSDGAKLGIVQHAFRHDRGMSADAATIVFNFGGFLGLGGRLIAIPGEKWVQSGKTALLGMTADDVAKLPTFKPSCTAR